MAEAHGTCSQAETSQLSSSIPSNNCISRNPKNRLRKARRLRLRLPILPFFLFSCCPLCWDGLMQLNHAFWTPCFGGVRFFALIFLACTIALVLPFSSNPGPAMVREAQQQDGTTGLGFLLLAQQFFAFLSLQFLVSNGEESKTVFGQHNGSQLPAACTTALCLRFSAEPGQAMRRLNTVDGISTAK